MTVKIPKLIGTAADHYYKARQARLDAQKKVDELKKVESALKEHLINTIPKSNASGVAGKIARVSVVTKEQPVVEDMDKFRGYINRTKRYDLANKLQPSATACREMWDDGKDVPGVGKFKVVTLSVGKV